tara:strand:+ start:1496 stop:1810 length:315 start_codon:yes stop_codon:yes gene_type:complete
MKPINTFSEAELKKYLQEYKVKQNAAWRRSRSRGETDKQGAHREYLDAKSMITNINYKIKNDTWLYNDLPDGTRIGGRRVTASGNPNLIGKIIDGFGRVIDETA